MANLYHMLKPESHKLSDWGRLSLQQRQSGAERRELKALVKFAHRPRPLFTNLVKGGRVLLRRRVASC